MAELNGLLGEPGSGEVRLPGWEDLPRLEYTRRRGFPKPCGSIHQPMRPRGLPATTTRSQAVVSRQAVR